MHAGLKRLRDGNGGGEGIGSRPCGREGQRPGDTGRLAEGFLTGVCVSGPG